MTSKKQTRISPVPLRFSSIRNVLWDRRKANISFITFHYSNCSCQNDAERQRDRQEHCSALYKDKPRHYKWLVLITKNILENPTNFSSTHVRICGKGRYAPDFYLQSCSSSNQLSFFVRTDNLGACVNQTKGLISP